MTSSKERKIEWNLTPAPDRVYASKHVSGGIDFRAFEYSGEGSVDYECTDLRIFAHITCSIRAHLAGRHHAEMSFSDGSTVIVLPGTEVRSRWRGAASVHGVYLSPSFVERSFERPVQAMGFARDCLMDPAIGHLLEAIRCDVDRGSPGGAIFIQSAVISLLHYLSKPAEQPLKKGGLSPKKFNILREMIDADLTTRLNIERLAGEVQLSAGHLSRAFKVSCGLSLHQYILCARVEKAKQLMRTTNDYTLDEVAEAVGFADGSHMSTVFSRITGKSPSQFRNS